MNPTPPLPKIVPMPLARLHAPFDDPDWIFEPKLDGFRAVAYVDGGAARLVSRNGNTFKSFPALTSAVATALRVRSAILDGEIVHLGPDGAPLFYDLMRRRTPHHFMAFDLLWLDGRDLRDAPLLDRKRLLRDIVPPHVPHTIVGESGGVNAPDRRGLRLLPGNLARARTGKCCRREDSGSVITLLEGTQPIGVRTVCGIGLLRLPGADEARIPTVECVDREIVVDCGCPLAGRGAVGIGLPSGEDLDHEQLTVLCVRPELTRLGQLLRRVLMRFQFEPGEVTQGT